MSETLTSNASLLDADMIWDALMEDPTFATMYEIQTESHKPFVYALSDIFYEYIDTAITPSLLMTLRSMYLSYCLENDYVGVVLGGRLRDTFQKELEFGIDRYKSAARYIDSELQEDPQANIQWLEKFGLNQETMDLFYSGDLTVGTLLLTQPMTIISSPPSTGVDET
jgi:hypothetical protein